MAKVQASAVGVDIVVPLKDSKGNPLDLSLATGLSLYCTPPNSTTSAVKTATKVGSGKDGHLHYLTVVGDFAVVGEWKVQSRVQYTNPVRDGWSEICPRTVAANLGT